MENGEWDEGAEELSRFVPEEFPRVSALPVSIRYRTFAPADLDSTVRATRSAQEFYLHRRRRLDSAIEAEIAASGAAVVQPLPSLLSDAFAVAQRQQATYQWLAQHRSADDVLHRFAVDRKLHAPPCLAAVNRALRVLGRDGGTEAVLDVLEDVLLDSGVVPLSTLLEAIKALPGQPVRAARVALTFKDALGHQRVPASVWGNLAAALAHAAQQMARPLEDHFMDLYERILAMVRSATGGLSDALVVSFGRCLLASSKPTVAAVRLVREELLGVRQRGRLTSAPLHLGAFLSDLLVEVCRQDAVAPHRTRHAAANADTLMFATDVIRYSHVMQLQLAPKVFDAVLAVCEQRKDYGRLCLVFVAMCLLSSPTLLSTLRVLEVATQLHEVRALLQRLLHVSCTQFFLWCLQRFPGIHELSTAGESQRRTAMRVFALLGGSAAEEAQGARLPALLRVLTSTSHRPHPSLAACGVSAAVKRLREQQLQAGAPLLAALHEQSDAITRAALQVEVAPQRSAASASTTVEGELRRLLPSPSVYCTVLSAAALSTLAGRESAELAFVRMMEAYRRKTGAVALVPFECACPAFGLVGGAAKMLRRWYADHDWCVVLPLDLSLQLAGVSACEVCCSAFAAVKTVHAKVMFIGGSEEEAAVAKARGVEPAVVMDALVRRLVS